MGSILRAVQEPGPLNQSRFQALPQVIDAIGEQNFQNSLLSFLHSVCEADHYALFAFSEAGPRELASASLDGTDTAHRQASIYMRNGLWKNDPTIGALRQRVRSSPVSLVRMDVSNLPRNSFRTMVYKNAHVCDRVIIFGSIGDAAIGFSILRSELRGTFTSSQLSALGDLAPNLISIMAKHQNVVEQRSDICAALTSLDRIEGCIATAPDGLARREAEVCARILYGLTTTGIALDLKIGEQTVMTYRKRAYARLCIGCHRELLIWYLNLWTGGGRAKSAANVSMRSPTSLLHQ